MGRKRGRVPNVLWTPFKDKAATLSKTIISLIPRNCNCSSNGKCLRCVFGNGDEAALAFLIRPNDPSDFILFMNTCFVVIPDDAPPLSPLFGFTRHWSQIQIVERSILASFDKEMESSNVICHGYQKFKLNSIIVKLLTSWAWELALERIGDSVMSYLLMHALIFLPIKCNAHQQVAGPLVNRLFEKFSFLTSMTALDRPSKQFTRKKKRWKGIEEISNSRESGSHAPFGQNLFLGPVGSRNVDCLSTYCPEASPVIPENSCNRMLEDQPIKELRLISGKSSRLPSWQRRKRCKRLMLQGSSIQEQSKIVFDEKDDLSMVSQNGLVTSDRRSLMVPTLVTNQAGAYVKSEQTMQLCLCCSVFQSLSRVSKNTLVNRKLMFYNMKSPSTRFLDKHFIHHLKSGFDGARVLFLHIFGLTNMCSRTLPASCIHKRGICSHGSSCLYHSLLKLLRVFLNKAKKCLHMNFLEKYCPTKPLFDKDTIRDVDSSLQASKLVSELSSSKQDMNKEFDQMPESSTLAKTRDCKTTTEILQHQFGFSQPYCLKHEVVSFVWAVCRNIVPPDLLGSSSSQRALRRNISRFIRLRLFENFSLQQCLHKLKISKFPLLTNMESFTCFDALASKPQARQIPELLQYSQNLHLAFRQTLLERWIFWFFSHIVVSLLQANFYITESEHGKQNVYFYRKSVWEKLSDRMTTCLKNQSYQSLDNAAVAEILSKRSFGFSKVRLCPKENGARPIANLKKTSKFHFKRSLTHALFSRKKTKKITHKRHVSFFKSVNTVLRDLHVIFKDLKVREPERWGSTVFSYGDIQRKLGSFLRLLKEEHPDPAMRKVYIVVSDVQKAFDTVKQDKLLSIIDEIQMEEKYSLQKLSEIVLKKKLLCTSENMKLMIQSNNNGIEDVPPVRERILHAVVVSQEQIITVRWEKLKSILEEHLKNNVLKLGQCFFLQTVGIPQGSVLSTLLCTLYYGYMEREVIFPYLANWGHDVIQDENGSTAFEATSNLSFSSPKYLLLRFVDDFLFMSTSKKQATRFYSRLRRGFREYNCYMNEDKFCTNFHFGDMCNLDSKRLLVGSDGVSFMRWSGLLINSCSLEVQADYTRYLNNHLSSTLTVSWQQRPAHQLKAKLRAYMRPKCHPIFFDTGINSPETIRLNLYQAFVLCAMKFHCYVHQLSFWCKIHPTSCLSCIEGSLRYVNQLMMGRMYKAGYASNGDRTLVVTKKEILWLGLTAYIKVLSKKKSGHKELLRLLRTKLAAIVSVGGSYKLKYAVDDSHSSYMWKIKY
ncbi:unnamed protein product [Amaranthus hypochondriacus]